MNLSAEQASKPILAVKGVIDIGATSIRMAIAEIQPKSDFRVIDYLFQSISIGKDVFSNGLISADTIKECILALNRFKASLAEYGIQPQHAIEAFATTAVREATNRELFLDRIEMATGIRIHVLSGNETNRLTFFGVRDLIAHIKCDDTPLLVIEIGGGATDVLVIEDGFVIQNHAYRLGTLRMLEELSANANILTKELIQDEVHKNIKHIQDSLCLEKSPNILFLGSDARFICIHSGKDVLETEPCAINQADISKLTQSVSIMSSQEINAVYDIPFAEIDLLYPALLIHEQMAKSVKAKKIFVGTPSLREGILTEIAGGSTWTQDFGNQVLANALELAQRFDYEKDHSEAVQHLSTQIFDLMQPEHGLGTYHRILLQLAAMLHDIGTFISPRSHHKHSMYLIRNSEIFGLGSKDLTLVSLIARYHRRAHPNLAHLEYYQLTRSDRFLVNKLAAILRLADALDRSHTGRCRSAEFVIKGDRLKILVKGPSDFHLERTAVHSKGALFAEVYGKNPIVIAKSNTNLT
jgi:exopolyphosphatase / guanosine-5'-triphosphate,3'-diphosphate pyrophosphatase